jgi:hypothetical protein
MLNAKRICSEKEKEIIRRKAIEAVKDIRKMAKLNGTSEMTLEEINEEIVATRKEMKEREKCHC